MTKYPAKPWLPYCGGTSRRTGKVVGERHRWPSGWGIGACEFCNRTLHTLRMQGKAAQR